MLVRAFVTEVVAKGGGGMTHTISARQDSRAVMTIESRMDKEKE